MGVDEAVAGVDGLQPLGDFQPGPLPRRQLITGAERRQRTGQIVALLGNDILNAGHQNSAGVNRRRLRNIPMNRQPPSKLATTTPLSTPEVPANKARMGTGWGQAGEMSRGI